MFGLTYLEIVLSVLTIIGFFFTVKSWLEKRTDKSLSFAINQVAIYSPVGEIGGVSLSLKNGRESLPETRHFKVLIYNSGHSAIHPSDLAGDVIVVSHAQVQDSRTPSKIIAGAVRLQDSSKTAATCELKDGEIIISFDHLSPTKAFLLEGLSIGHSQHLTIDADLKSYGPARQVSLDEFQSNLFIDLFFAVVSAAGMVAIVTFSIEPISKYPFDGSLNAFHIALMIWFLLFTGVVSFMMYTSFIRLIRNRKFKNSKSPSRVDFALNQLLDSKSHSSHS